MVWPFPSREAAEDFQLEHGLLDWRVEAAEDVNEDHHAICARDREPWPCHHVRVDDMARRIEAAEANRCARCKKQIGWRKVVLKGAGEFGEDLRYHGKLGACFNEAVRRARELNDEHALRQIAQIERTREDEREWRRQRATA